MFVLQDYYPEHVKKAMGTINKELYRYKYGYYGKLANKIYDMYKNQLLDARKPNEEEYGFILHTAEVIQQIKMICKLDSIKNCDYKIDMELLMVSALLHDVGAMNEIKKETLDHWDYASLTDSYIRKMAKHMD